MREGNSREQLSPPPILLETAAWLLFGFPHWEPSRAWTTCTWALSPPVCLRSPLLELCLSRQHAVCSRACAFVSCLYLLCKHFPYTLSPFWSMWQSPYSMAWVTVAMVSLLSLPSSVLSCFLTEFAHAHIYLVLSLHTCSPLTVGGSLWSRFCTKYLFYYYIHSLCRGKRQSLALLLLYYLKSMCLPLKISSQWLQGLVWMWTVTWEYCQHPDGNKIPSTCWQKELHGTVTDRCILDETWSLMRWS